MNSRQILLIFALFTIIFLLWQAWLRENPMAPPASEREAGAVAESPTPAPAQDIPQAPAADGAPPPAVKPVVPVVKLASDQRIEVTTDLIRAEIDTLGGDLRYLDLLQYPVSVDKPEQPLRLLNDQGEELFVTQSGLIGQGRKFPNHKTKYLATQSRYQLGYGQDQLQVPLRWTGPDGTRYTKIYTFYRNQYVIDVSYLVENTTATAWRGYLYGQFLRMYIERSRSFFMALPGYLGGAIYTPENKFEKIDFSDMEEGNLRRDVTNGWLAMMQRYFVGAWLPAQGRKYQFYSRVLAGSRYNLGYKAIEPVVIAPGQSGRLSARLYLGPTEQDRLKRVTEGLVLTVDYGWLTAISAPLFWALEWVHGVVGNWGWAIIIITILIKLAFYPLSAASYKSMAKMKLVQPRMQSLKERYSDDKQKLQQAMMQLYKTEKVNPMGGCLPILIQIPVFIALYWVLLESVELRQADFALWVNDLSSPDPYFVLPILMGISMFAQQLIAPSPTMDPMHKKMMMTLPVIFTVFFLFFPAGLVLYWLTNNILSITQQWYITHTMTAKGK